MSPPDFVSRGRQLTADGRHLEAVKVCRLGLLANPKANDGRLVLGCALLALGRFDEALAETRLIMQSDPGGLDVLRLKAEALLGRGDGAQALEILEELAKRSPASSLDPLIAHARMLAAGEATATLGEDDTSISWTRDYPIEAPSETGSYTEADHPLSHPADVETEIEEPSFALATADTMLVAAPESLDAGDFDSSVGTVEVDPSWVRFGPSIEDQPTPHRDGKASGESGPIELSVSDLEPMEKPRPSAYEPSSEEGSLVDLIPATPPSTLAISPSASELPGVGDDVRGFDSEYSGAPSSPTHAYGPERARDKLAASFPAEAPLFLEREPERPKSTSFPTDMPGLLPVAQSGDPVKPTAPESPRARAHPARERQSAPLNLGPEVSELFPEDEDGVSKLSVLDELPGAPTPSALGEQPKVTDIAASAGSPQPSQFGAGAANADYPRPGSRHEDMRMIRVGLGLSPDPSQQGIPVVEPEPGPGPPPPTAAAPVPPRPAPRFPPPTAQVKPAVATATRKTRTMLSMPIIAGLAVLLVGGGVAGGVVLRGWRASRGVDAAAERAAQLAATGSYLDQLRARSLLDRALEFSGRRGLVLARARVGAALSAEFGIVEDNPEVIDIGDRAPDALATHILRALAAGNADLALGYADLYTAQAPNSIDASYLRGLALADLGQLDAAADALRRPADKIALARAQLVDVLRLSGAPASAAEKAGDSSLPAIAIARARALARAGALPEGNEPENTLRAMVAEGAMAPLAQQIGVSPSQGLDARLALIEAAIARGKSELAQSELLALADLNLNAGARFRLAYAEALLRTGDAAAASEQYKEVAAAWPQSSRTKILGAQIELAQGDTRAARAQIEQIESVDDLPRALAIRGQLALEAGRLDDAKSDLDKALAAAPGLEDAVLARARLDLAIGDADKALERIEGLPAGLFGSARDIMKARALRAAGRLDEARETLAATASAGAPEGLIELARLEAAAGRVDEARTNYAKVLAKYPRNVSAALERSLLDLDNGGGKNARKALEKLATERPNDPMVLVAAARARTLMGDAGAAAPLLDAAAKVLGAPAALIARERGRALSAQRIYAAATKELESALAAMPRDAETHELLMETHFGAGRSEAATALLKSAMGPLKGRDDTMSLLRGIAALLNERFGDAETAFLAARTATKTRGSGRKRALLSYWLGRAYESAGKLPVARRTLEQAIDRDSTLARAYLVLGDVELQDGKKRAAEKRYKRAVELDPVGNPRAFLMLGQLYLSLNRQRQAKDVLEQFLELDPNGPQAAEARELLGRLR